MKDNWYRSEYLTIFSIICAGISVFIILSSIWAFISFIIEEPILENSNEIWLLRFIFKYYPFFTILNIVIGITMLLSSLYLLQRKEWARKALIAIFTLGAIFFLILGINIIIKLWQEKVMTEFRVIKALLIVFILLSTLFWEGIMIAVLWFLNSKPVKTECW